MSGSAAPSPTLSTMHIDETRDINRPLDEVFAYVADFSTVAEWDPGIRSSRRIDDGELGVGSSFDVVATFNGREMPLVYEITKYEPGSLIVLETNAARFDGIDTIEFSAVDDTTTRVRYQADFAFKGFMRLVGPLLGGTFDKLGKKAMDGMKATLG